MDQRFRPLNRQIGRALHAYDMIADGDRIAVGVSGGYDSLFLIWALQERLRRIPVWYELVCIYVDPGFEQSFRKDLVSYCRERGYHLIVEATDFGVVAHSAKNRENPCFLCSRLRRKRLMETAQRLGCRKLALGHNKDDLIETLFLNILYAGEIGTMVPKQPLFHGKLDLIRPLSFVDEEAIRRFCMARGFPRFRNPCPSAETSKRREIKDMLNALYQRNPKVKGNIFSAMHRCNKEYLL